MNESVIEELREDARRLLESGSWHCVSWVYPYTSCQCGNCHFIEQALHYAVNGQRLDESHLGYIEEARDRVLADVRKRLMKPKVILMQGNKVICEVNKDDIIIDERCLVSIKT